MKQVYTVLAIIIVSILPGITKAQNIFPSSGSAGIGTATPDASSILEVKSTTKGMLIPRMSKIQRDAIAVPAIGLMIYQTNSAPGFYYYDGSAWRQVAPAGVNKSLSNLNTQTAINVDLVPNAPASWNLGSALFSWKDAYLDGNIYSKGLKFISHPGTSNTFVGDESGIGYTSGSYNTGTGAYALGVNSSGNYNTASGYASLYLNTTGVENSAFGATSLFTNSTGSYNTAVGSSSLRLNTTGFNNAAVGASSLYHNTAGQDNAAVGAYSLYQNTQGAANTAIGSSSLYSNTTGYHNTATGFEAMYNITSAFGGTAIGYRALYSDTAGSSNTAVGYQALYKATGSTNTAIGYQAMNSTTSGTTNAAGGAYALANNTTGTANSAFGPYAGNSGTTSSFCSFFGYNANQTVNMVFTNSMALGYNANITASNQVRVGNSSVSSIGGYANWTNISDGRFKKNIKENVPGLAFINKLKPVTYNLDITSLRKFLGEDLSYDKDGRKKLSDQPDEKTKQAIDKKEKQIQTGFVAQDVEKAAKELGYDFSGVDKPENESSAYGLRYSEFVVPLVKAVQELSKENDDLQKQIDELKAMIVSGNRGQSVMSDQLSVSSTKLSSASLEQNMPNPFNHATTINYTLPQKFTNAQIVITDKTGKTIKAVDLSNLKGTGKGSLTLDASSLASGTYIYSLQVNGSLIGSRQMVLTK